MSPRVLSYEHAFEIESTKYFNTHMKAHVRQLHIELKSIKKGNHSVTEFVLRVKAIADSLLVIDDVVSEQDQVDSILNGLPEE